MAFIFMVLHWPDPTHRETLVSSMYEMGELLVDKPGCLAVEPPYLTEDGGCLVGISKWQSKEAFLTSGITLRLPDETVEGEIRPRQRFLLEEASRSPVE
jgi:hypothetical protein